MQFLLPHELSASEVGFRDSVFTAKSGQRTIYMCADKSLGFGRNNNLTFQACTPDAPLRSQYGVSKPREEGKSRWSIDVTVTKGTPLGDYLTELETAGRETVRVRAAEMFPRMKCSTMNDDQLNMAWTPIVKWDDNGLTGTWKIKVDMPPTVEEEATLPTEEYERRKAAMTTVTEVLAFDPATADSKGELQVKDGFGSPLELLTAGCGIMPAVEARGIWIAESTCGISFLAKSMCVWPTKTNASGLQSFNVLGARVTKRKLEEVVEDDETYAPYVEE